MKKRILIITNESDLHADKVEKELLNSGEEVIRLNTDSLISDEIGIYLGYAGNQIIKNRESIPFSMIKSVWYRRPNTPQINIKDEGQRKFAERELKEFLLNLYFCLNGAFWVSDYQNLEKARRKYLQSLIAQKCGMRIPKTLVTNSPDKVRDFFEFCHRKMIYKTLRLPTIEPGDGSEMWGVPTSLIYSQHLKDVGLIQRSGGIFQEYIEKEYELRITIIGEDIFAVKIDSQKEAIAKIDWRDGVAYGKVKVTPTTLPLEITQQCLLIVKEFGLAFGAIDMILTPENEYVFLEINPNGQWLWVEELTNFPLIRSMVKLLKQKGGEAI